MPQPKPVAIRLNDDEIAALEKEAARLGSLATTGPTAGKPSWRKLVRDIANGRVKVKR